MWALGAQPAPAIQIDGDRLEFNGFEARQPARTATLYVEMLGAVSPHPVETLSTCEAPMERATRRGKQRTSRSTLWRILLVASLAAGIGASAEVEHIVVHRDDTMYYIVPWMTQLKSGELILSVREAHRRRKDQMGHVDPTARGVLLRSSDGGRTWRNKTVTDDETYRLSQTEDVPVTQLSDGTLLLNLYSWAISPLPVGFPLATSDSSFFGSGQTRPYVNTFEGLSVIRSTDAGRTWSRRQHVQVKGLPRLGSRVPAVELPDKELLLPVYGRSWRDQGSVYKAWMIRSTDGGKTWGSPSVMAEDPEQVMAFAETALLRKKDGGLMALHRTADGGGAKRGYLFQTDSSDEGRTWTKPLATKMWGWPAHLLELKDGRILCTYGYRREPYGVRASLSGDGGKTWDVEKEIVLRDDGGSGDLGYPSSVELPDGRVLTIYWFNQEKPGDPESEVRYIAGTFYRP